MSDTKSTVATDTQPETNTLTLQLPTEINNVSINLKESVQKVNISILSPQLPCKRSVAVQATSDTESESEPDGIVVPVRYTSEASRARIMNTTASPSKKRLRHF
ncbi:hypothetical protein L210DRAFT_3651071 [Boletus edulis BED1]|uniref:Uncharacterized protein n=1 Tax=Boletus edulis BED1 TaxID=1328754 RepID=A0AAD4BIJ0_BOLED|nr:hypothetical protein L210DRAFT_3651071 [Boletus edulis BED1]